VGDSQAVASDHSQDIPNKEPPQSPPTVPSTYALSLLAQPPTLKAQHVLEFRDVCHHAYIRKQKERQKKHRNSKHNGDIVAELVGLDLLPKAGAAETVVAVANTLDKANTDLVVSVGANEGASNSEADNSNGGCSEVDSFVSTGMAHFPNQVTKPLPAQVASEVVQLIDQVHVHRNISNHALIIS
jgi:hypothetical protein